MQVRPKHKTERTAESVCWLADVRPTNASKDSSSRERSRECVLANTYSKYASNDQHRSVYVHAVIFYGVFRSADALLQDSPCMEHTAWMQQL